MVISRFLEALRQGCVDPDHAARLHGGKGGAPAAPDYAKAAEKTALSQMSSQYTPYGSQVFSRDKSSPSGFASTINLAPEAQQTLDTQLGLSRGLADTASGQLPAIQDFYSRPLDYQSLSQPAYDAMTSRLNPEWQQREGMERNRLVNQGLQEGSEAYQNAMREFNESRNDAYQQATLSSLQNAQQFYGQPLNIFNALRTGAQVQNPQFGGPGQGTNYLGAAQGQNQAALQGYGIEQGGQNSFMNGLFTLGAAAMLSDRRLKTNIERVGTHRLGIGIYEYDLLGERQRGVMADEVLEVKPEAVTVGADGYMRVDYGQL